MGDSEIREPIKTLCFDLKSYNDQARADIELDYTFRKIKETLSVLEVRVLIEPLTKVAKDGNVFFRRRVHVQSEQNKVSFDQVKDRVRTVIYPYFFFVDFESKKIEVDVVG